MNKNILLTIASMAALATMGAGCATQDAAVQTSVSDNATPIASVVSTSTTQTEATIEYKNTQYGFSFSLPLSWKGYSIGTESWDGHPVNANGGELSGVIVNVPGILIQHPLATLKNPRQNIPIMIFTIAQWDLVEKGKLIVSAAPIGPTELGSNAQYVFAVPARYDYSFPPGVEEVQKILGGTPLLAFNADPQKNVTNNQTSTSLVAKWNTYTDSKQVGFTFKYPKIAKDSNSENASDIYITAEYGVTINNLDTMADKPSGYDKVHALKDQAALAKGDPSTKFGWEMSDSLKMLNVPNTLGKELTVLGQFDECDVRFRREAIFYKDGYQIILSWSYGGKPPTISDYNPSYFKVDKNCAYGMKWKDSKAFYTDLVAGKTDAGSQEWFTDFDEIIKTIQFQQ